MTDIFLGIDGNLRVARSCFSYGRSQIVSGLGEEESGLSLNSVSRLSFAGTSLLLVCLASAEEGRDETSTQMVWR